MDAKKGCFAVLDAWLASLGSIPSSKEDGRSGFSSSVETHLTSTLAEERRPSLTRQEHRDLKDTALESHPSPTLQEQRDLEDIADLEGICRTDFGLQLEKVRSRMLTQANAQQSAFRRLCEDLGETTHPPRRQEIVIDFVNEEAKSAKAFCLSKAQEKDKALMKGSRASDREVRQLKEALEVYEFNKTMMENEFRLQFFSEKAALEVSLREELVACQICLKNARSVVIMPCLHAQFCKECLEANNDRNNNKCPACRGPVLDPQEI
ncbi:hypothetical protein KP509_30G039600 [Ceratopteris richardii]|uniref:RING-type domain-containing protein n=1 Tax=Ceratopteris richardii TaxID=49495 RepID=A0A8T2R396_CERRI|nr:hypothetical protein KP509_30G039600 [Ceratopteris richardii]